jgi:hypothetical protein
MENDIRKDNVIKNFGKFINEQINNKGMESLLKYALDDAFIILEKQVPQTKKKTEIISILDIEPSKLTSFMKSNDIPDNASFGGRDNGYHGGDDIVLEWNIDVQTTEKEKLEFKNKRFHDIAFRSVYNLLTKNGYKRLSGQDRGRISYTKANSQIIMFDNKTVYEMYMNKNFDLLLEYYSMYFKK